MSVTFPDFIEERLHPLNKEREPLFDSQQRLGKKPSIPLA